MKKKKICICAVNDGTRKCPAPKGKHIWGKNNRLNDVK